MKTIRIIAVVLIVLLLSGCNADPQIGNTPTAPGQNYTPGELTYYFNLPQEGQWTLSTHMGGKIYAMVLSSKSLDSLMNNAIDPGLDFYSWVNLYLNEFDEADAKEYPLYLYQTYQGMDWKKVAELKKQAEDGDAEAETNLRKYEQMYADKFATLTAEDLPEVYPYLLEFRTTFSKKGYAYRYHNMDLKLGRDEVTVPLGSLFLSELPLWDGLPEAEELAQENLNAIPVSYWTDTAELSSVQLAATEQPQTLTGIAYLGAEVTLSNIFLTWEEGGEIVIHEWDGASPFTIPGGVEASLSATLHHGGKSVMGYCAGGYLAISREYKSENQRLWYSLPLTQHWNVYELYAMVVDGIDLAPYYAYAQGYTPAEPKQDESVWETSFGDVIYDKDGYEVTAVSAQADDFAYRLTLSLKNKTKEDVTFYWDFFYVNGYKTVGTGHCDVPAGEQAQVQIDLPWEAMAEFGVTVDGPEQINLLDNRLTVKNGNGEWLIISEPMQLLTKEVTVGPEYTVTPEMIQLVNAEKYEVWLVNDYICEGSIFYPYAMEAGKYYSKILFVNKADESMSFRITDVTVNGEVVPTGASCFLPPERFMLDEYFVFDPKQYKWDTAEEISITVKIEAADGSWTETSTACYNPDIPLS